MARYKFQQSIVFLHKDPDPQDQPPLNGQISEYPDQTETEKHQMMTVEEKWHFDLFGYVVLKQPVPVEDVQRMVSLAYTWHDLPDSKLPPPLRSYRDFFEPQWPPGS